MYIRTVLLFGLAPHTTVTLTLRYLTLAPFRDSLPFFPCSTFPPFLFLSLPFFPTHHYRRPHQQLPSFGFCFLIFSLLLQLATHSFHRPIPFNPVYSKSLSRESSTRATRRSRVTQRPFFDDRNPQNLPYHTNCNRPSSNFITMKSFAVAAAFGAASVLGSNLPVTLHSSLSGRDTSLPEVTVSGNGTFSC